ncbi:MAG: AraC family transcriptional regulator [Actinomycetota bacterium]|nr:AraC family transcriptional regulator [Actinomycetota bacterium]
MLDLADLRTALTRLAGGSATPRRVAGATVFATARTTAPIGTVTEPALVLVAQGAKRSMLGDQIFDYAAGQYLVVTVDLPLTSNITRADASAPFLAVSVPLEPATIAQLLIEASSPARPLPDGPALSTSEATAELVDAITRLLRLSASPDDQRVLAPGVRREIHWRLLTGPQGGLVRQVGLADSSIALVARAVAWIKERYDQAIRIDDLAADVGSSTSALNRRFRAATSMSPLQYQKQLRLQHARARLLADPTDIAGTGHAVGYGSASQFSREYRRLFGLPPGRDVERLLRTGVVLDVP